MWIFLIHNFGFSKWLVSWVISMQIWNCRLRKEWLTSGAFCCRAPLVHLNEFSAAEKNAASLKSDLNKNEALEMRVCWAEDFSAASKQEFVWPSAAATMTEWHQLLRRPSRWERISCVFLWRCFFLWLSSCMSRFTPS